MARVDLIRTLYKNQVNINDFKFDNLRVNPLLSYIHPYAIMELNKLATSVKLQSQPKKKFKIADEILAPYGFKRIAAGTNRIVYKHLEDQRIVLKIAKDATGISDNMHEYFNQRYLKPFVSKCFEVSPCSTVGIFERVQPITSKAEFYSIAPDVFSLLYKMIGKYILEDIGTKYFLNYGLRDGFGPVLLDYPYMYELDGAKIYCNEPDLYTGMPCGGEIDYDDGFNELRCTKCGKVYLATELEKNVESDTIVIESDSLEKGEIYQMEISVVRTTYNEKWEKTNEEVVSSTETQPKESSVIVSRRDFERSMDIEVKTSSKTKVYKQVMKSKPAYKVENPTVMITVDSHAEATQPVSEKIPVINTEPVKEKEEPVIKPESKINNTQSNNSRPDKQIPKRIPNNRTDHVRQDIFAMDDTKISKSEVNEDYIKKELMGKTEKPKDETDVAEEEYEDSVIDEY